MWTSCERVKRGDELRLWQEQERAERLQPLCAPLSDLTRRLLLAHIDWEIQEQMHLDYASLEVRARPEEGTLLIACRWAEDLQWQGTGAVEIRVTREFLVTHEFSVTSPADFYVIAVPEVRESFPDQFCEFSPTLPEVVMDKILCAVEHGVLAQTRTTA